MPFRRRKSIAQQYLESFLVALALATLSRALVFEAFRIPSPSMLPALVPGDYLLSFKLGYGLRNPFSRAWLWRFAEPRPGDVVVFVPPSKPGEDYVKRVVAVAGETVEVRGGRVFVDGRPRDVPALLLGGAPAGWRSAPAFRQFGPVVVPPGSLFVLGDNREGSIDSRHWGFVGVDNVEGRAAFIYWSWNEFDGTVRWERVGKLIK